MAQEGRRGFTVWDVGDVKAADQKAELASHGKNFRGTADKYRNDDTGFYGAAQGRLVAWVHDDLSSRPVPPSPWR